MDAGLWSPRRPHADSRLRADARGRDGDRINTVLRAAGYNVGLGYNEDQRQLQLMDGWQASEAWRANLRAEYILSEAGGRGRRRCGVGRAGYRPADDQWLNIVKWTHFGSQGLACARCEAVEASMSLGKGLPHCCAIATGGD